MKKILLSFFIIFSFAAQAQKAPQNTYVLAIGVCPPWKPSAMSNDCKNSVNKVVNSLSKQLAIPQKNITLVLDKNGTYQGVVSAFTTLQNKVTANDRTFIYMNVHGGKEAQDGSSYKGHEHELLVLWTDQFPFTIESAVELKQWMTSQDLRNLLNGIKGERIVIIDACNSGYAKSDLSKAKKRKKMLAANPMQTEALIFSANANQSANSTTFQPTMALFSNNLGNAVMQKDVKNFDEAFEIAKVQTSKDSFKICSQALAQAKIDKKVTATIIKELIAECDPQNPQKASKDDPNNLLKKVIFMNNSQ
jgi:hypothetical protein